MTQAIDLRLVHALEKLFISSKQSHIEQHSDGSYSYKPNGLATQHLINHLAGTQTIGVFSGEIFSKYLCFDVDTGKESLSQARDDVRILQSVLYSDFNISYDCMPVAYSGNKGYHVYLCFDDVIHVDYLHAFYREVLERAGYSSSDIEFRPTAKYGVKLPLGINKVTGKRCNFVDTTTPRFKQKNKEFIYEIKQLNAASFKKTYKLKDLYEIQLEEIYLKLCNFLYEEEARAFKGVLHTLDFTEYQVEHAQQDMMIMLRDKRLIYPDTRNKYTLLLAIFLKTQGYEMLYTERTINEVMLNSKRQYKGLVQSSENHIKKETKRIVKYVFNINITLGINNSEIVLYGDEIRDILMLKDIKLMKLYTSMLVHAKRHQPLGAETFYMAYSVMQNYGNTANRNTLKRYIDELERLGRIKIEQRRKVDTIRSEVEGHAIYKANVYSIKKDFNQNPDEKVLIKAAQLHVDIIDILAQAIKTKAIKFNDIKPYLSSYNLTKLRQAL